MTTALLFVTAFIATGSLDSGFYRTELESNNIVYLSGDTTGFEDYETIGLSTVYATTFNTKLDTDYYRFVPASSGIYTFSAVDGLDVSVNAYGYNASGICLLTSFVVNSSEDNFGYNHGVYLDVSTYNWFFFTAKSKTLVFNQSYFVSVDLLEKRNSSLDVFRYDVNDKTYSSLAFSSTGSGSVSTSGYNPTGLSFISLPNYGVGVDFSLTVTNGVNTLITYPYSCVAATNLTHDATSFLVGPNILATAAHCVVEAGHAKPGIESYRYYFGANQENVQTGYGSLSSIYFSPNYFQNSPANSYHDWAFGVLDDNYGDNYGYLPITKPEAHNLSTSSKLIIDGYKGGGDAQILSYANFMSYDSTKVRYTHVTAGGDSGAPIISYDDGAVIGIHTGSLPGSYSIGVYFDTYKFAFAEQLIAGNLL